MLTALDIIESLAAARRAARRRGAIMVRKFYRQLRHRRNSVANTRSDA